MKGYQRGSVNFTMVGPSTKTILIPATKGCVIEWYGSTITPDYPDTTTTAIWRTSQALFDGNTGVADTISNAIENGDFGDPVVQTYNTLENGNIQMILTVPNGYTVPIRVSYSVFSIE